MAWIIRYAINGRPDILNGYYFTKYYYTGAVKSTLNIKEARVFKNRNDADFCCVRDGLESYAGWQVIEMPKDVIVAKHPAIGEKAIGESVNNLGWLIGDYAGEEDCYPILRGAIDSILGNDWPVHTIESWDTQAMFKDNFWLPSEWLSGELPLPNDLDVKSGGIVIKSIL